jgi:phenylacetate-CoA ligase
LHSFARLVIEAFAPLYRRLPHPARSLAASARGLYLKHWRYGERTEEEVAGALERDRWPAERWGSWLDERLARILRRAASRVPYYRAYWKRMRPAGKGPSPEVLENWPILGKEAVRQNPLAFLAEDRDAGRMFRNRTGGTTGKPLSIYSARDTLMRHYALFEARIRRWHGVSRHEPWAILGGHLVVPRSRKAPPFWVHNKPLHQLALSSYHLAPSAATAYARALWRHAPTHLVALPSSGSLLAAECLEAGITLPKLAVFSGSEVLLDSQRALLSRAFGSAVRNTYGMVEMAAAASECGEGSLHSWPEEGLVEILEDGSDSALPPGKSGRLVATGLVNEDMPLIRYDTGDRASLAESPCRCGRSLPVLQRVEGRSRDLVVTRDGRRIWNWSPVFYGLPVAQAQIFQESLDSIRARIVPSGPFGELEKRQLVYRIRLRLEVAAEVSVETVAELPRTAGGRVRPVISLFARGPSGRT